MIELRAGSATDVGLVRSNNQDQLLVASPLFAVADGMGGAAAGEVASATAIDVLRDTFGEASRPPTPDDLIRAAQAANRAVWEQAEANPEMRGMGTTLVALALVDGNQMAIVNIGDSRLYSLHQDQLQQVTYDHNLVAELVAQGRISKEEAEFHPRRNIMTRALGVDPEVPVDLFLEEAEPGSRYLLCSDGLPREVKDDQIASLLRRLRDPEEAASELVAEAKRRGGNDNITVVVVDVLDSERREAPVAATPSIAPSEAVKEPVPAQRGATVRPHPVRARLITPRVVLFVLALLVVLGGAAFGVGWYARSGYFVGLQHGTQITIFKGRPGGVLWIKPTVDRATPWTTSDVLPRHLSELRSGQEEPSFEAAIAYISRLIAENEAAIAAASPPTTLPTTTTTKPAVRKTTPTTAKK